MKWWERMLGRQPPHDDKAEREEDRAALRDLRASFDRVHDRTDRLEAELLRINDQLRRARGRNA